MGDRPLGGSKIRQGSAIFSCNSKYYTDESFHDRMIIVMNSTTMNSVVAQPGPVLVMK